MIPQDYAKRVYAGVLGKIIGVYVGRPFEGWSYERIMAELGEINYYVHEKLGKPLVVTDDDISGTFTFLRALTDYGCTLGLTAEQIGNTWLNYLIENRTILWWGGLGQSTEHTAYLRLKEGIRAPHSGSMERNGQVVAEQIGSQIFIDGWAMVAPGDPELAADLARRAASVSHDGEAIYGAQVVAAMEAQAFVEGDLQTLLDTAVSLIPRTSIIYRMINDIRDWHATHPDWRKGRELLAAHYGYDRYGGNCHMVPNHGLIILSLLYGGDSFQKSLMIVNTSGWDTDCNSANVGCLLGIKNGLAGIEDGPDWRGPVADRLYLPTADGGRAITDAVTETYHIVNAGRALADRPPVKPKDGARFHFELPGSVQGFMVEDSVESRGAATLENVQGHSVLGRRTLAIHYRHIATGRVARVMTPTFIPPEALDTPGYGLLASPTLYPGQTVRARVSAASSNHQTINCELGLRYYGPADELVVLPGPSVRLQPQGDYEFSWQIPELGGHPVAEIGVTLSSAGRSDGTVYLDYLTWEGEPSVHLSAPKDGGTMWRRAWVDGVDQFVSWSEPYRLIQNRGTGLLIQGTREWQDYRVSALVTAHLAKTAGIGARVQGMRRYYGLLLVQGGLVQLVKCVGDAVTVLAEQDYSWDLGKSYELVLTVNARRLVGCVQGTPIFDVFDESEPLTGGAIALICSEGRIGADHVRVHGLESMAGNSCG